MSSKRNFKNLSPSILDTYNELFLDQDGCLNEDAEYVFFRILKAKSDIEGTYADKKTTSYEAFIGMMESIIEGGDRQLYNIIDSFVENNYCLALDKIT